MNKPKVFNLLDFVTFGMLAVIAIVADIAVLAGDAPLQAKALMTVVSLAFAAVYAVILIMRKKTIDSCAFLTDYGWGVRNNSKAVITKEEFDADFQKAKDLWASAIAWSDAVDAALKNNYLVVFENGVGVDPESNRKIAGITKASKFSAFDGELVIYEMDTLTLQTSAFKHEVGHLIYFGKYGELDNAATHKFMADHNLP